VVRVLIELGANVNQAYAASVNTPLLASSQKGHLEVVELLLLNRAEVTFRSGEMKG
jgi:hypothetical protein